MCGDVRKDLMESSGEAGRRFGCAGKRNGI